MDDKSDFFIFAACGYIESKIQQSMQLIKQLPKDKTIIVGCLPSIAPELLKDYIIVDTLKHKENLSDAFKQLGLQFKQKFPPENHPHFVNL